MRLVLPLYRYLGGAGARVLPVPLVNILNGGKHAIDSTDFQEFMIAPLGAPTFREGLRWAAETFHALGAICSTSAASPPPSATRAATRRAWRATRRRSRLVLEAIERAGYRAGRADRHRARPGHDRALRRRPLRAGARGAHPDRRDELIELLGRTGSDRYPIVSLEDGLAEDDWEGWRR